MTPRQVELALSDDERAILQRSLALDRARLSYRNSFSATPQADTYPVLFHVTDAGKALVMG